MRFVSTGGSVVFTVAGNATNSGYTVGAMSWDPEFAREEIPQLAKSGQWANWSFIRKQLITLEGDIIGTSSTVYVTNRKNMMGVLLPNQGTNADQEVRNHGTLYVTFTGQSEVYAEVVIDKLTADISTGGGDGPQSSEYEIALVNDYGYWRATADDSVVKI